ncbi:MDR family MFS transporter [Brevibacillus fluminis]|uniref:MDR family MFS transporter n=1 Tax=Brevibacillus fluminis TaxID=511487 RepID=UPI003F8AD2EE
MHWRSWDLNLKTRLIGETLFHTLFWMYFPFITLYFSAAFGKHVAGMLMSVPPLLGILGNLTGGFLADRIGRRPVMLMGAFLQSGMFALFACSLSPWTDYLAFIGIGVGGSLYSPASSAMVADLTTDKDRRLVFATFVTATNIGAVFGPALGSIFFFHYRSGLLWTCTLVTLLYAVAILFIVKETLPARAMREGEPTGFASALKEQWRNYGVIFRDRAFATYIVAGILVTIAFMQLDLYLAVYVKEFVPTQALIAVSGWSVSLTSAEVFGLILGLNGLMFVLGSVPVTKWFERWSDRDMFILSALLFGMGMFLVGLTTNVWLLLCFMIVLTVGEVLRSPVAQGFVSKYAPEEARGRYMGASSLQFSIGRFLAPLTVILSEWLPPSGVFGFIFLCTIVSAVLYVKLFRIIPARYADVG